MPQIDDGGPAFPRPVSWRPGDRLLYDHGDAGMTLLDYTAIQMLPWALNETGESSHKQTEKLGFASWHDHAANEAYKVAAAMIRARRELTAVTVEPEPAAVDADFPAAKIAMPESEPPLPSEERARGYLQHSRQHNRPESWPCSCGNAGICDDRCPHSGTPCIETCKCPCPEGSRMACTHPRYRPVGDNDQTVECICCGKLEIEEDVPMVYCQDCDMGILDTYWDAHRRTNPTHKIGKAP